MAEYHAIIDEHEEDVNLDCGCRLWRPFSGQPKIVGLSYCDAHGAVVDVSDEEEAPPFRKALQNLINCHSKENGSDTPDFVLRSPWRCRGSGTAGGARRAPPRSSGRSSTSERRGDSDE